MNEKIKSITKKITIIFSIITGFPVVFMFYILITQEAAEKLKFSPDAQGTFSALVFLVLIIFIFLIFYKDKLTSQNVKDATLVTLSKVKNLLLILGWLLVIVTIPILIIAGLSMLTPIGMIIILLILILLKKS